MSGGMRQRIVGAIGISCEPRVLIADEPTTSLDVTIQAQYLQLLKDIQKRVGLAMIFITHNIGIVAKMCDYVGVMYAGRLVERAPVRTFLISQRIPIRKPYCMQYRNSRKKPIGSGVLRANRPISPISRLDVHSNHAVQRLKYAANMKCRRNSRVDENHYTRCWLWEKR